MATHDTAPLIVARAKGKGKANFGPVPGKGDLSRAVVGTDASQSDSSVISPKMDQYSAIANAVKKRHRIVHESSIATESGCVAIKRTVVLSRTQVCQCSAPTYHRERPSLRRTAASQLVGRAVFENEYYELAESS